MVPVDVIWFLTLMWVNTNGTPMYSHTQFQTRQQCMVERSIKIDIGDDLVKRGIIKSYTADCIDVTVSGKPEGKSRFMIEQPKEVAPPMKSACSGE